jgi:signal transduction histidine kinase/ligand-binding sensor domain-containing protein
MRKPLRSLAIYGFMLALCAGRLCAMNPNTRISQYAHSVWRVQDGVLNAAPNVIAQSKDGYVWIGTETGLLRFDGARFVQWTPPHWDELGDPEVYSLLAASDGTLWISTPTRLASWKDGKLTVISPHGRVNAIAEDHQGRIWIAVSRSPEHKPLCQVLSATVRCFGTADGVPFPYAATVAVEADDSLIVTSADTVIRWRSDRGLLSSYTFENLKRFASLHGISVMKAESDGSSLIGIGFAGKGLGLERLQDGSPSPYTADGLDGSSLEPQALLRDRSGSLWIGTFSDGLYRVAGSTVEHFTTKDGLSGDSVHDLQEDREGNLWVATDGGLDCFRDLKVISLSTHEGLAPGFVSSVLAARDGSVLIGTHSALNILRDGKIVEIGKAQGLPGDAITALLEDQADRYWMGVSNELAIYDGRKFTLIKRPDGQPIGTVVALAANADGSIWASVVSPQRALLHVKDDKVDAVLPAELIGAPNFLFSDRRSGVWLSNRSQLGHYSDGHMQWFPPGLKRGLVNDLVVGADGSVFASSIDGVWGVKEGKTQSLGTANGLPCQAANGLVFSNKQSLIIRTSCGLIEIGPDALSAWWSDPGARIPYQLIDSYDGAHPSNATFSPQMSRAPDGRIWIANQGGIQVFDPDHVSINSMPPPVHIEEVIADRARLDPTAGLTLPPLTRDIEIHYTALSFSVPQKVRFRYMLDGRDTTWQDPGTRRIAFYQDLKPGHYRFHVIAANNDGVWNNSGDTFDFSVKPAWFQTIWFRVLWVTCVCLLLWAVYRLRVSYIARAIGARFDERLDERTRMARELHDTFLQTVQGSKMVADDALDPASDQIRMRHALERLSVWLGQAVTEGRAALHALRVSTTEQNHLAAFLERTANEQCQRMSMSVALTVIGDARDLHPIVRDEIARIAEEAIRNTSLHSKASQLHIELRYADNLYLCLKDNGVGIDPEVMGTGKAGHFGLQGMKERSDRIRGKITIKSALNTGTEIILRVPGEVVYRRENKPLMDRLRTFWPRRNHTETTEDQNGSDL